MEKGIVAMDVVRHAACNTPLTLKHLTQGDGASSVIWCPKCQRQVDSADTTKPGPFSVWFEVPDGAIQK